MTRYQLSPAGRLDDGFHVVEVPLQRAAARGRERVLRLRHPPVERLLRVDVAGILELAGVDPDVAIGRLEDALPLVERYAETDGQGADDGQARLPVDDA